MWQPFGKSLIVIGALIMLMGIVLSTAGRIPYIGRLPGDIYIKRDYISFYFPLTTCIIISVVFMLISRFFGHK